MARALCCLPLCLKCISPDIASLRARGFKIRAGSVSHPFISSKMFRLLCELNDFHQAAPAAE